jgi:hypothetical protein
MHSNIPTLNYAPRLTQVPLTHLACFTLVLCLITLAWILLTWFLESQTFWVMSWFSPSYGPAFTYNSTLRFMRSRVTIPLFEWAEFLWLVSVTLLIISVVRTGFCHHRCSISLCLLGLFPMASIWISVSRPFE